MTDRYQWPPHWLKLDWREGEIHMRDYMLVGCSTSAISWKDGVDVRLDHDFWSFVKLLRGNVSFRPSESWMSTLVKSSTASSSKVTKPSSWSHIHTNDIFWMNISVGGRVTPPPVSQWYPGNQTFLSLLLSLNPGCRYQSVGWRRPDVHQVRELGRRLSVLRFTVSRISKHGSSNFLEETYYRSMQCYRTIILCWIQRS